MKQMSFFDDLFDVPSPKDELIEKGLLKGSGFENGKKRILSFASSNPSPDQLAKFLQGEYGIGGYGSPIRKSNYVYREHHDGKGIQFEGIDRDGNEVRIKLKWIEVAKVVIRMVEKDIYL